MEALTYDIMSPFWVSKRHRNGRKQWVMDLPCSTLLILPLLSGFLPASLQQNTCSTVFTFNHSSYNLSKCSNLPSQEAVLAWTFFEENTTLDLAFAGDAPSSAGWVGWGLNPTAPQMVGTSALIVFSAANGSNILPYMLTTQVQTLEQPLSCSPVNLTIENTAVEINGSSMSFFVSLRLPSNQTLLNHVWNRGPGVNNFQPMEHSLAGDGLTGFETIDMFTAQPIAGSSTPPHYSLKRIHGIINTVAWGIMFPLGVIFARYVRPFPAMDPIWFYLHESCQTLAYCLGISGWGIGMRLRTLSGAIHRSHLDIAITLFVIATLQVFALLYRPNKGTKIRRFWNVYHHTLGYVIVLLGIINVFQGLNILQSQSILKPDEGWRKGYIIALCIMAVAALVLEVVTWVHYFRKDRGTTTS